MMKIKRRIKILCLCLVIMMIPIQVSGAEYWTGTDYYVPNSNSLWKVSASQIMKVDNAGRAYNLSDISSYSAYITNKADLVGQPMENAFFWMNKSRIAYVKLFKVRGGQELSFLFDKSIYLYCAEFDSNFYLVNDGNWITNGDRCKLKSETAWVMIVFRKDNGNLEAGSGTEQMIDSKSLLDYPHRYILFEPFKYNMNMNGGIYMGSTGPRTIERLGVESVTLPTPSRTGYIFKGWKSDKNKIYNGVIPVEYNEDLFRDVNFTAEWEAITPKSIVLDKKNVILEENGKDKTKINATVYPEDAVNKTVTFSSSNPKVATVDSNGNVTPLGSGEAVITATTANGIKAECKIYVMGFSVTLPTYCQLDNTYEIDISIFHNGTDGMSGRKRVVLNSEDSIEIVRVGDGATKESVFCESASQYNGGYSKGGVIADTMVSKKIYYRLRSDGDIKKAGDYEGSINFTVSVI